MPVAPGMPVMVMMIPAETLAEVHHDGLGDGSRLLNCESGLAG